MPPTISKVEASQPLTLAGASQAVFAKAQAVDHAMDKARKAGDEYAHHSKGKGETARRQKIYLEHTAGGQVVQQLLVTARTLEAKGHELDACRTNILALRGEITGKGFTISDDGSVGCSYQQNAPDKDAKIAQARDYYERIQGLLDGYQVLDDGLASLLNEQMDALDKLAKGVSETVDANAGVGEITANQAKQDAEAVNRGNLSDEERRRVVEDLVAAGLTPEQAEAKASGQDVPLGKDQSGYLGEFYKDVKADKLEAFSEEEGRRGDTTGQQALADGLYAVTSPKTKFPDGSRGGIAKGPKDLQDFLTSPSPQTTSFGQGYGVWQSQVDQLSRLSDMLGHGSAEAAQGSEANLGLMMKASQFTDPPAGAPNPDAVLQKALTVAGRDHTSDAQLLNPGAQGASPEAVKFTEEARNKLLAHSWSDKGAALSALADWIPGEAVPHADGPGGAAGEAFRAEQAGHAARGLADAAISTSGPGGSVFDALHHNPNPQFTQALGQALTPYLPELAHSGETYTQTRGFGRFDEQGHFDNARKLFGVIDSDDTAARQFNAQALTDAKALEQRYAVDPRHDTNMLEAAGGLEGLVKGGLDTEAKYRSDHLNTSAAEANRHAGLVWDDVERAVSKAASKIPGYGTAVSFTLDELSGIGKEAFNHPPGPVPPQTPRLDYTTATTAEVENFNMLQGLAQNGHSLPPHLQQALTGPDGQLITPEEYYATYGPDGTNQTVGGSSIRDQIRDYLKSYGAEPGDIAANLQNMRRVAEGS